MTREILTRIAKENNITISYYDEVDAFITPNGKKVVINFAHNMGTGTYRDHIIGRTVVKLISSIERNAERTGITSSDYCTQGWTRIFDVRWAC